LQDIVEFLEGLLECFGVVTLCEILVGLEGEGELPGAELGDLHSSVAIEDPEQEGLLVDAVEEHRVFHVLPPT
jgi:hypothetical protein